MNDADPTTDVAAETRREKSDVAFRTISEVSEDLGVTQHVLRFWESRFSHIRPLKRGGGRRYYRPEDIVLLKRIKSLLYTDGLTIKGVQKLLRDGSSEERVVATKPAPASNVPPAILDREELERMVGELTAMRDDLRAALAVAA